MRIEMRNVRKCFGRLPALLDVNAVVPTGARVGVIGPNGSGKSTLLRILMGLLTCDGEVLLDGRDPFEHRAALAGRLAYAPQVAPQLAAPVGEVVRAVELLRSLDPKHVASTARSLELDLDPLWRRPFRNLSGGTKQKLLLALAFSAGASLLILDEPTASLDVRARDDFGRILDAVPEGTTVLLCSHRLDEVRPQVDRVLALIEGRVVYDGAADSLDERSLARASRRGAEPAVATTVPAPGARRSEAGRA